MDDFTGVGGSYLVDPKTGKRTLVMRTQEPLSAGGDSSPTEIANEFAPTGEASPPTEVPAPSVTKPKKGV